MAEYEVTGVRVLRPYILQVTFVDGYTREVDLEPELWGPVFEPLKDPEFFARAFVDEVGGTVAWPNGADIAPEFLRYGPDESQREERERRRRAATSRQS